VQRESIDFSPGCTDFGNVPIAKPDACELAGLSESGYFGCKALVDALSVTGILSRHQMKALPS
jgi:hypothetical protein